MGFIQGFIKDTNSREAKEQEEVEQQTRMTAEKQVEVEKAQKQKGRKAGILKNLNF